MISLSGVSKRYQNAVFENVNLTIRKGEFVYVVGDSGAGKTTLLKLFYGEEKPSNGLVQVFGVNLSQASTETVQAVRRKLGIIFQDLKLIDELSVADNISLGLDDSEKLSGPERQARIKETLNLVGLSQLAKKKVALLSGGEKQRVAAARALVRKPEIIIADEPTGSLDRDHSWQLIDLLQKLHLRGITVVVATHDREIVRRARRKSFILKSGRLMVEEGVCLF